VDSSVKGRTVDTADRAVGDIQAPCPLRPPGYGNFAKAKYCDQIVRCGYPLAPRPSFPGYSAKRRPAGMAICIDDHKFLPVMVSIKDSRQVAGRIGGGSLGAKSTHPGSLRNIPIMEFPRPSHMTVEFHAKKIRREHAYQVA
jgi:hypothetical protein